MTAKEDPPALEVRNGDASTSHEEDPVVARELESRLVQLEEEVGTAAAFRAPEK